MFEYQWWQEFTTWLADQFAALLDAVNPVRVVVAAAEWLSGMLPAPNGQLAGMVDQAVAVVDMVGPYVAMADYLINLPLLLAAVGLMAATEAGLLASRVWKFIRSHVT